MKQILYKLFEHQYLGRDEARTILQNIAQGKYNDAQVASLITVFLMRNISVEELCGFRRDPDIDVRIICIESVSYSLFFQCYACAVIRRAYRLFKKFLIISFPCGVSTDSG